MLRARHLSFIVVLTSSAAFAQQTWSDTYEKGLAELKARHYAEARGLFQAAIRLRPEDVAEKTLLPGSAGSEPSYWRSGGLYSPNFAAAYAGYRLALETSDDVARTNPLRASISEFAELIQKGQASSEAVYFLSTAVSTVRDAATASQFKSQLSTARNNWQIDGEIVTPEEIAAIRGATTSGVVVSTPVVQPSPSGERIESTGSQTTQDAGGVEPGLPTADATPKKGAKAPKVAVATPAKQENPTGDPVKKKKPAPKPKQDKPKEDVANPVQENPTGEPAPSGTKKPKAPKKPNVAGQGPTTTFTAPDSVYDENGKLKIVANKYALVIGNSEGGLPGTPEFAATDAELISTQLTTLAGYSTDNIVLVKNGSADAIQAAAKALADKMVDDGTVMIYFSGVGANLGGKDFVAGTDATAITDQSHMVAKNDLYRMFMVKGARIFAFYQVNRTAVNGASFGGEVPIVGSIAQMQSTTEGSPVYGRMKAGKQIGLYTDAFIQALTEMRSNKIPILDFSWAVFNNIRRLGGGTTGGGSAQTPTLPTYSNMGSDSRF